LDDPIWLVRAPPPMGVPRLHQLTGRLRRPRLVQVLDEPVRQAVAVGLDGLLRTRPSPLLLCLALPNGFELLGGLGGAVLKLGNAKPLPMESLRSRHEVPPLRLRRG